MDLSKGKKCKTLGKEKSKGTLVYVALKQIATIYKIEGMLNDLVPEEPYNYFEYLLTEIPNHMEEKKLDFLNDLLPWSVDIIETEQNNNIVNFKGDLRKKLHKQAR